MTKGADCARTAGDFVLRGCGVCTFLTFVRCALQLWFIPWGTLVPSSVEFSLLTSPNAQWAPKSSRCHWWIDRVTFPFCSPVAALLCRVVPRTSPRSRLFF